MEILYTKKESICVCVYIYIYIHTHTYVYIPIHIRTYRCIYIQVTLPFSRNWHIINQLWFNWKNTVFTKLMVLFTNIYFNTHSINTNTQAIVILHIPCGENVQVFYSFFFLFQFRYLFKKISFFLVMMIVFLVQRFYNLMEVWTFCPSDSGLKFDTHFYQEKIFHTYWKRQSSSILSCFLWRKKEMI